MRVLVVEDHADSREMLEVLLTTMGHVTCSAGTGADAMGLIRKWQPDVVLLDLGLPDMDGRDMVRSLRASGEYVKARFVALTGWSRDGDLQDCEEAGIHPHLLKPVTVHCLEAALRSITVGHGP